MSIENARFYVLTSVLLSLLVLAVTLVIAEPVSSGPGPALQLPTASIRATDPDASEWGPDPGEFAISLSAPTIIAFFNIDRNRGWGRIHRGSNATGEILYTIDSRSGRIWAGPNATGPLTYTLEYGRSSIGPEVRVHEGNSKGPIVYTISDDDMHDGPRVREPLVYHGSRPFWGPIQFLLPLLADHRIP